MGLLIHLCLLSSIKFFGSFFQKTLAFVKELSRIIPNSTPLWRKSTSIKKMVKQAIENNYTDILVINEDNRDPNGLIVCHLPDGPTAHFKLSNVKITKGKQWYFPTLLVGYYCLSESFSAYLRCFP